MNALIDAWQTITAPHVGIPLLLAIGALLSWWDAWTYRAEARRLQRSLDYWRQAAQEALARAHEAEHFANDVAHSLLREIQEGRPPRAAQDSRSTPTTDH
jgi:hypothetical protein